MLRNFIASAGALALLLVGAVATPNGQGLVRSDRAVYFTFSQPVALPGKTLPAGKYLFKLLDSQTTRTVVQVYNSDGTQQIAMFMTVPAERLEPPNDGEVRFMEAGAEGPAAIKTWWYPGERRGWEFIYPRNQALQLAKNAKESVLTTTEETPADKMNDAPLARVGANGEQTPYDTNAAPTASAPTGTSLSGTRQDTTSQSTQSTQTSSSTNSTTQQNPNSTTNSTTNQNPSSSTSGSSTTPATSTTNNPNAGSDSSLPRANSTISTTRQNDQPSANTSARTPAMQTTPSRPAANDQPATPAGSDRASATRDRDALPGTASATPTVLLIGVAAFAAAWFLRRVRPLA